MPWLPNSGKDMSDSGALHKFWPLLGILIGSLMTLAGIFLIVSYVSEAILARIGEPDQSLLFWYLPFLFVGLLILPAGLGLGISSLKRLRRTRTVD